MSAISISVGCASMAGVSSIDRRSTATYERPCATDAAAIDMIVATDSRADIDRRRLGEERVQDVIDRQIVLLLEARMRYAGEHRELLVRVGQPLEELDQVVERGDAVVLPAQHEGGHRDRRRVDDRQLRAHV